MNKKILAPIFTDHMVLQRDKEIKIFGQVKPGEKVTVTLEGNTADAVADAEGKWELSLPEMSAAKDLTLTASTDSESVTLKDIAIGEVWLCGGQSNMEFELGNCTDWERVKKAPESRIRFFYTPKLPYKNDAYYEAFDKATWMLTDDEGFHTWSAVAYLFAENLLKDMDVTIGLVGCNWGGTSASAWMDRASILASDETKIYIEEFEERNKDISLADQQKAYDTYESEYTVWNAKCGQMYIDNPATEWSEVLEALGPCQWPGPMNNFNPFRPCGLYEIMLKVVCPYTLRGFIWYQGESDDHRPRSYYTLFENMVKCWRREWGEELPMLCVQLPMHRYKGDRDYKNWPIIREAQLKAALEIPGVNVAVCPDCGQFNEIHPVNKGPVGERLALLALSRVYKVIDTKEAFAPIFSKKIIMGDRIVIYFDCIEAGLALHEGEGCYEIAGADKIFHPAEIKVNEYTIELFCPEVKEPVYARYCWSNYCTPTLFSKAGLPVSPFRTDIDDELTLELSSAAIQQIMEV